MRKGRPLGRPFSSSHQPDVKRPQSWLVLSYWTLAATASRLAIDDVPCRMAEFLPAGGGSPSLRLTPAVMISLSSSRKPQLDAAGTENALSTNFAPVNVLIVLPADDRPVPM